MTSSFFHPIDPRKYLGLEQSDYQMTEDESWVEDPISYQDPSSLFLEIYASDNETAEEIDKELLNSYPEESMETNIVEFMETFFHLFSKMKSLVPVEDE